MHDLLFRNALVFDGSGGAPAIQDVAVTAGRIADIGPDLGVSARQVIEADGLGLMPGIIDSHTRTRTRTRTRRQPQPAQVQWI